MLGHSCDAAEKCLGIANKPTSLQGFDPARESSIFFTTFASPKSYFLFVIESFNRCVAEDFSNRLTTNGSVATRETWIRS